MNNQQFVKNTFAARAKSYDGEFSWIHDEDFISDLVPAPAHEGKFLDVCAGTGAVSCLAQQRGWDTTATDISAEMMEKIPSAVSCVVADVCALPFADDTFDMVSCRQGLQYVDLEKALRELYRVSKKEVRLAHITIHSQEDLQFWKDYFAIASPGRVNVFLPDQIATVAKQIGYKTAETSLKTSEESYTSSLMHLPEDQRNELISRFRSASKEFLLRNKISLSDQDVRGERRWEYIVLTK